MQKQVKVVEVVTGDKGRVDLLHTELNGKTYKEGKPDKIGTLASKLDEVSLGVLKTASKGDTLTIDITKEGNFWNLSKVSTEAPAPKKSTWTGGNSQAKKEPFDSVGVKVGAARNQAIAFLSATKANKFTLDDVDALAYEIVIRQAKQEDAIRSNSNPASSANTPDEVGSFEDTVSDDEFFK